MASEVYRVWFQKALSLRPGEKLYLQAETKNEQKEILGTLKRERAQLQLVNPELAMQIDITLSEKDAKLWVLLIKRTTSRVVGYVVSDGQVEKVQLNTDEEKLRRISLMLRDGYSLAEIEENEGQLSEEELNMFSLTR